MATELVDVHADLEALRKLYGLLQNSSGDGTQEVRKFQAKFDSYIYIYLICEIFISVICW